MLAALKGQGSNMMFLGSQSDKKEERSDDLDTKTIVEAE